jgi:hypothetical protein
MTHEGQESFVRVFVDSREERAADVRVTRLRGNVGAAMGIVAFGIAARFRFQVRASRRLGTKNSSTKDFDARNLHKALQIDLKPAF